MLGFVGGVGLSLSRENVALSEGRTGAAWSSTRSARRPVRMVMSPEKTDVSGNSPLKESKLISRTEEWKRLVKHAEEEIQGTKLRDLLKDSERNESLIIEFDRIFLDISRQRVTSIETAGLCVGTRGLHGLTLCLSHSPSCCR